jgi:hypothetical protein
MDDVDPRGGPHDTDDAVDHAAVTGAQAVGATAEPGLVAGDGPGRQRVELIREAMTMALYLSMSLLAVLVTITDVIPDGDNRWQAAGTILVTALGLLLAHHVAFRLSSRLVNEGLLTQESRTALKAQAYGGGLVAVIATVPVLLFGEPDGEEAATLVLLAFVAWVGYRSARKRTSRLRSALYVLVVVGAVTLVLVVKLAVGH